MRTEQRSDWVRELQTFSHRNAGRLTTIEVDGPDLGAQQDEHGYPLRGVAYDPRDGRVDIMLGDLGSVDRHLTRSLENVRKIDVLEDARGRDRALCVEQDGDVQTILKFA
jgi:hypothetical protein